MDGAGFSFFFFFSSFLWSYKEFQKNGKLLEHCFGEIWEGLLLYN